MKIRPKLAMLFAGIGILAVSVTSAVNYIMAEASVKIEVANQLVGLRATKGLNIETAFRDLKRGVETEAQNVRVIQAFTDFRDNFDSVGAPKHQAALAAWYKGVFEDAQANKLIPPSPAAQRIQELYVSGNPEKANPFKFLDAKDGSAYSKAHRLYQPDLDDFRSAFGLHDVLLFDPKSMRIVYTDRKEADLACSLTGPLLTGTGLATAIQGALAGRTTTADFRDYLPSANIPSAFMATPLRRDGQVIGVLVAQIGLEEIDKIVSGGGNWAREGLGDTGETILFGEDGYMRSNSRYASNSIGDLLDDLKAQGVDEATLQAIKKAKSTVLRVKVPSGIAGGATAGEDGFMETTNYIGKPIVAAYGALRFQGLRWGIVVERDQSEAYQSLDDLRRTSLYSGCGMLLITLLISYLVSGSFTRPLTKLTESAHRLARGELGVRANIKSPDEYGELGQTFDHMVAEQERFDEVADGIRRNIVHDLKTPLTVIKGMAETLQDPDMADESQLRQELVGAICEESDRLLDDLQDILVPVSVNYKPEKERFDLSLLVETAVRSERHTGRSALHKLVVKGTEEPFAVVADRRKIRRVVENLLSNAVKYSPGDGKLVVIEILMIETNAVIRVSDEGLGMSTEQLAKVLGVGGQIEDHTKLGIEGTGLGLNSVQRILEAHGGELHAKSQVGRGSTFIATFPA